MNSHLGTARAAESAETDDDEAGSEVIDLDRDASVGVRADGVEEIDRVVAPDRADAALDVGDRYQIV